MITATQAQMDAINKAVMELFIDNGSGMVSAGWVKPNTIKANLDGKIVDLKVDQLVTLAKRFVTGWDGKITCTIFTTDLNYTQATLFKGLFETRVHGTTGELAVGIGNEQIDHTQYPLKVKLHKYGISESIEADDFTFWKMICTPKLEWSFGQDGIYERTIELMALSDTTKETPWQIGLLGSESAYTNHSVPMSVTIQSGPLVETPCISESAQSIVVGEVVQKRAIAHWKTATGVTAAIDEVGDITDSQTAFTIKTLAGGTYAAGSIIVIGTEAIYISAISGLEITSCQRGVFGTTAAAHLNNAVITGYTITSIDATEHTDTVWASDTPAEATVGTTKGGTGANKPGRIIGVSAGGPVITVTVNTKASPSLTLTVA